MASSVSMLHPAKSADLFRHGRELLGYREILILARAWEVSVRRRIARIVRSMGHFLAYIV